MKKNVLPMSVFDSTRPETENPEQKAKPSHPQATPAKTQKKKRKLTLEIDFNIFQRLWKHCGLKNMRMNAAIEEALDAYLKGEKND